MSNVLFFSVNNRLIISTIIIIDERWRYKNSYGEAIAYVLTVDSGDDNGTFSMFSDTNWQLIAATKFYEKMCIRY